MFLQDWYFTILKRSYSFLQLSFPTYTDVLYICGIQVGDLFWISFLKTIFIQYLEFIENLIVTFVMNLRNWIKIVLLSVTLVCRNTLEYYMCGISAH